MKKTIALALAALMLLALLTACAAKPAETEPAELEQTVQTEQPAEPETDEMCIRDRGRAAVGRSGLRNLVNPENASQYLDMFSAKRRKRKTGTKFLFIHPGT